MPAGRRDRRALVRPYSDGLVKIELAAGKVSRVTPWTNPAALTTVFPFALTGRQESRLKHRPTATVDGRLNVSDMSPEHRHRRYGP
jgi:hypothetical protein